MIRIAVTLISLIIPSLAQAAVEGSWPQEARGGSLRKPAWVLVVPARRSEDGGLVVWERTDPWVRQWIVPQKTPEGLRTVTIVGDSEDKRLIGAQQIDNMQSSALRLLARKYDAPAIALVVSDGDEAVVAGWVPGMNATWEYALDGTRAQSMDVIDNLFSGQGAALSTGFASPTGREENFASIVAQRTNPATGVSEYRVRPGGSRGEELLQTSPYIEVLGRADNDPSIFEVRPVEYSIEDALRQSGLSLR